MLSMAIPTAALSELVDGVLARPEALTPVKNKTFWVYYPTSSGNKVLHARVGCRAASCGVCRVARGTLGNTGFDGGYIIIRGSGGLITRHSSSGVNYPSITSQQPAVAVAPQCLEKIYLLVDLQ